MAVRSSAFSVLEKGSSDMERNNTPELETKRLILRKFSVQDTEALFSLYSDEEINTYLPWFPLRSLEEARTL